MNTLREIAEKLKSANSVGIFSHIRPDGDAYGSALALALALEKLGIKYYVCNESDPPSNLAFLEGLSSVVKKPPFDAEVLIAVDSSEVARLGTLSEVFLTAKRKGKTTVNVDHHISNDRFAALNFVRECAANCMNVATLIKDMGVPFDRKIATYLMVGLLSDSGNFTHDDVTEETFSLAAELTGAGAQTCGLAYELFKKQPKERAALHAAVTGKTRYYFDDKFAVIVVTREAMAATGADVGMTEGLVDFPLSVDSVEVAASLLEMRKGQYKVSLRSKRYADVNGIARAYGGGGHVRAAGCMLFGELEEVLDKLSYTVSQYL
ncbi:MAG: bifunctional oligoribonuclease/PAP phosphatase NrnA [Clostridia bacterium]|nr:bifunctional oligoribonuclease/PAP phosphatase NrnA [Clostridia bacterium]